MIMSIHREASRAVVRSAKTCMETRLYPLSVSLFDVFIRCNKVDEYACLNYSTACFHPSDGEEEL